MDFGQILNNTLSQILSPTTFGFALAAIGLSIHFGFAGRGKTSFHLPERTACK